jgi:hypothetical protein
MTEAIGAAVSALTLLAVAVIASDASSILLILAVLPFMGVVCGSDRGAGQVVSSRKTIADQAAAERYIPEAEARDAEPMELPIDTLEGIEPQHADILRQRGIETLQDLLESQANELAGFCGVPQDRAQRWIAAARFAWMKSVSEEDAEAIVYGGAITEIEELAAADPPTLYRSITQAIELGHVSVSERYRLTPRDVEKWVKEAKDLV